MEKTDEVYGDGDEYTTEFRQYDPRVGRWFSPDPLASMFADETPYSFCFNNPLKLTDVLGLTPGTGSTSGSTSGAGTSGASPGTKARLNKISIDQNFSFERIWKDSRKGKTFVEHSFIVLEKKVIVHKEDGSHEQQIKTYATNFHTDNEQHHVEIKVINDVPDGKIVAFVHTHPLKGYPGTAFSSGDISLLRGIVKDGFMSFVEAGSKRYALVIVDAEKATQFFERNSTVGIDEKFQKVYKETKGTHQEKIRKAVYEVVGDGSESGIQFYETTDKKKQNFEQVKY